MPSHSMRVAAAAYIVIALLLKRQQRRRRLVRGFSKARLRRNLINSIASTSNSGIDNFNGSGTSSNNAGPKIKTAKGGMAFRNRGSSTDPCRTSKRLGGPVIHNTTLAQSLEEAQVWIKEEPLDPALDPLFDDTTCQVQMSSSRDSEIRDVNDFGIDIKEEPIERTYEEPLQHNSESTDRIHLAEFMTGRAGDCSLCGKKDIPTYCPDCPDSSWLCLQPCFRNFHKY